MSEKNEDHISFGQAIRMISTKPSRYSTVWNGKRSLMATVLLWAVWFARLFSLLQIAKVIYRVIKVNFKRSSDKDKGSKRPNVPPIFVELYWVLWAAALISGYFLHWNALPFFKYVGVYFLFESFVWVLYYTILRRFYEESYSLYHVLEYFVVLILLVPVQAFCLASLCGIGFWEALSGLLGAGMDATPYPVKILGAFNGAIVIALVISSFPNENTKTAKKKQENYIVGCGDVVVNRLLPALKQAETESNRIRIADLTDRPDVEKNFYAGASSEDIFANAKKVITDRSVVWIETPPEAHVFYLKSFLSTSASRIVVEKPVTNDAEELAYVRRLVEDDKVRERVFFLSYYLLEKALPLYYIADINASYKKYLIIEDHELVLNYKSLLGNITELDIAIMEGEDDRRWTFDDPKGQLFETFIHNAILASLFCGIPKYWKNVTVTRKDEGEGKPKTIELTATSGKTHIHLIQGKFIARKDRRRGAYIRFEEGSIRADFDSEQAEISAVTLDRKAHVRVKDAYRNKYSVQTDLVARSFAGEVENDDVDGLRNQLEIIEWLSSLNLS